MEARSEVRGPSEAFHQDDPDPSCPPSAVAWPICVAGLVGAGMGLAAAAHWRLDPLAGAATAVAGALLPALLADGVPRAAGLAKRAHPRWNAGRLLRKGVGLIVLSTAILAAFLACSFFDRPELAGLRTLILPVFVGVLALAGLYTLLADRLLAEEDGLHALGAFLLAEPHDARARDTLLLSVVVKGFFLTLMASYVIDDIVFFQDYVFRTSPFEDVEAFKAAMRGLFALDATLAAAGYVATWRLFGWDIRDVDGSWRGWAVCLLCYEPFFPAIERSFLNYHDAAAEVLFAPGTLAGAAWVCLVLALEAIYLSATVMFGPLFSNLTRRRIVTSGPYRFSRHPAYLAKNASWWVLELPSLLAAPPLSACSRALKLALVGGLYALRARSEERMLAADPVYRRYSDHIRRRGPAARIGRLLRR